MIERDQEYMGRILRRLLLQQKADSARNECVDEESLAAYLSGDLSDARSHKVEEHLVSCALCCDELVAAHQTAQPGEIEAVPPRLLKRAMALVPLSRSEPSILTLVVELVKDSLDLISTSGELSLATAPAAIRGKGKPSLSGTVQVSEHVGDLTVAVEVERTEDQFCQVAVNVTSAAGVVADGLRFSLLSGDREQASYLARGGAATFERIPPGKYQLAITNRGDFLGAVQLTIKENSRE